MTFSLVLILMKILHSLSAVSPKIWKICIKAFNFHISGIIYMTDIIRRTFTHYDTTLPPYTSAPYRA